MKRGTANWVTQVMGGVILLIFVALVVWGWMTGAVKGSSAEPEKETQSVCRANDDCQLNKNGTQCIIVYPGDFLRFCGCLSNSDCISGICGSNNRCS
jgi:hypothetical protein